MKYIIWSNGYCEQWGNNDTGITVVTITFIKTFADTNYNLVLGTAYARDTGHYLPGFNTKTTTGFQFSGASSGTSTTQNVCNWRASGYLADGQY